MLKRQIACAWIQTADNQTLVGNKKNGKGVWAEEWRLHQLGGGKDEGETFEEALIREVQEESGLNISQAEISLVDNEQTMSTVKTLPDGAKVDCEMTFWTFLVKLPQVANHYTLTPNDDLTNLHFVPITDLELGKLTPPAVKIAKILGWGK